MNNGSEVVIIQPNTDPYTEKFTIPFEDQLKKVISTGKQLKSRIKPTGL